MDTGNEAPTFLLLNYKSKALRFLRVNNGHNRLTIAVAQGYLFEAFADVLLRANADEIGVCYVVI